MSSKIEWTDETWNPVVGCTKIAAGCKNCYAERMAWRLVNMPVGPTSGNPEYLGVVDDNGWTGKVECCEHRLDQPLHWRKPRNVFVCSMSDLFHEEVPFEFIDKVMETTHQTRQHTYQILTKRAGRMYEYFCRSSRRRHCYMRSGNVWLGVSCSHQAEADKNIPILLQIPAAVHFVSLEPLLKGLDLTHIRYPLWARSQYMNVLTGKSSPSLDGLAPTRSLGWVAVGGESGPKRRPCKLQWIRSIVNQCKAADVPVFVKQIDTTELKPPGVLGNKVSKNPEEWPEDLRIREYPDG